MFEAETGINVVYDTYDSNELMEAKILAGASGYDLTVPTSTGVARLGSAEVVSEVDRSRLSNWENLSPEILNMMQPFDPGNKFMAPYNFWTFGIVVNEAKLSEILGADYPHSWELLYNPDYAGKLSDCGIRVVDSVTDIFPITLMYLGLDPSSEDRAELQKAIDLLVTVSPNVSKFATDGLTSAMANGDACMGVTWSGDALIAKENAIEAANGVELSYFIPTEGTSFDFDGFSILSDAPNPDEAYEFINFMMRADVAAKNANYIRYGTANLAAHPMIDEIMVNDPGVFPTEETFKDLFVL